MTETRSFFRVLKERNSVEQVSPSGWKWTRIICLLKRFEIL